MVRCGGMHPYRSLVVMFHEEALRIAIQTSGWSEGSYRNIWFVHNEHGPSSEYIPGTIERWQSFIEETGLSRMVLVAGGYPPDKPSRDLAINFLRRHETRISDINVFIPRDGMWGATVRSVATAIFMLSGIRTPVRFVRDESELMEAIGRSGGTADEGRSVLAELALAAQ